MGEVVPIVTCGDHNPVQHRDMKPAWCNRCGRTADYKVPHERPMVKESGKRYVFDPDATYSDGGVRFSTNAAYLD